MGTEVETAEVRPVSHAGAALDARRRGVWILIVSFELCVIVALRDWVTLLLIDGTLPKSSLKSFPSRKV